MIVSTIIGKGLMVMAKFLRDVVVEVASRKVTKSFYDRKEKRMVHDTMTIEEVENVLRTAFEVMGDYLADGEKLYLIGFMNFEPKDYKEKHSKHPQTQEDMVIPAYRGVLAKPSDPLKKKLAEGYAKDHGK